MTAIALESNDLGGIIGNMKVKVKGEAKLLDVLSEHYPDSSKRTLRQMVKGKRVSVDGRVVMKADMPLAVDQEVSVGRLIPRICLGVDLLYEDQDILVINKAERLLSVPLDEDDNENVLEILRKHFRTPKIYAVHRIDRGTSGVMIFAKGKRCVNKLAEMFREHKFEREYLAIVVGRMKEDSGTWASRLVERKNYDVSSTKDPEEGRLSITHFAVLKRSKNFSYLRLHLETGRKHQIRVHCKDAGHPVVGDKRYGEPSCDPISRMALHAFSLVFDHPHTGKEMHFSAPLPEAFVRLGFIPIEKK